MDELNHNSAVPGGASASLKAPPGACQRSSFLQTAGWSGLAVLVATALFALASPLASSDWVQWSPWLAGIVLFGLPHGARDLFLWLRLKPGASRAKFVLTYVLVAAAVLIIWRLSPAVALLGFLLASGVHFGASDLAWSNLRIGLASFPMIYSIVHFAVRSLIPLAISAARWPDELSSVAFQLLGGAGSGTLGDPVNSSAPSMLLALTGFFLIPSLLCAPFAAAARHPAARGVAFDQLENMALVTLFWVTPPVLAIGAYFVFWHSQRHVARLASLEFPEAKDYVSAVWRFHRAAAPITLAAIVGMGALTILLARVPAALETGGGVLLILLSALTMPHLWVIANLDCKVIFR